MKVIIIFHNCTSYLSIICKDFAPSAFILKILAHFKMGKTEFQS